MIYMQMNSLKRFELFQFSSAFTGVHLWLNLLFRALLR